MMDNQQPSSEINENKIPFAEDTIDKLSTSVTELYRPNLEKTQKQLHELVEKQAVIVEQLHNENLKISKFLYSDNLHDMFTKTKIYTIKLQTIRKQMKTIHERVGRLKKRAIKLKEHKEKETFIKEQQRKLELQREQDLIAKHGNNG